MNTQNNDDLTTNYYVTRAGRKRPLKISGPVLNMANHAVEILHLTDERVKTLDCRNNYMKELVLPTGLKNLNCSYNSDSLVELELPTGLETLVCNKCRNLRILDIPKCLKNLLAANCDIRGELSFGDHIGIIDLRSNTKLDSIKLRSTPIFLSLFQTNIKELHLPNKKTKEDNITTVECGNIQITGNTEMCDLIISTASDPNDWSSGIHGSKASDFPIDINWSEKLYNELAKEEQQ